jgi:hypothetical protein
VAQQAERGHHEAQQDCGGRRHGGRGKGYVFDTV